MIDDVSAEQIRALRTFEERMADEFFDRGVIWMDDVGTAVHCAVTISASDTASKLLPGYLEPAEIETRRQEYKVVADRHAGDKQWGEAVSRLIAETYRVLEIDWRVH